MPRFQTHQTLAGIACGPLRCCAAFGAQELPRRCVRPPPACLQVTCPDRHGLLADVVRALRELPLEITAAAITTRRDHIVHDVFQARAGAQGQPSCLLAAHGAACTHCPLAAAPQRGTDREGFGRPRRANAAGMPTGRESGPAMTPYLACLPACHVALQVELQDAGLPGEAIASAVEAALRPPGEKKRRQASPTAPSLESR